MKNYVAPGECLTLAAPYDRLSGQGAMIGSIFGVATVDVLNTVVAVFQTEGIVDLAKTAAQAWTAGQKIYWNAGTKLADSTSTAGPLIGVATRVEANPTSTGHVKLIGNASATAEGAQTAVAAPAAITEYTPHAAGAVAVTSAAATDLDTTAAALNTLVDEVQALQVTVADMRLALIAAGILSA